MHSPPVYEEQRGRARARCGRWENPSLTFVGNFEDKATVVLFVSVCLGQSVTSFFFQNRSMTKKTASNCGCILLGPGRASHPGVDVDELAYGPV
jgi:hypothetical protein